MNPYEDKYGYHDFRQEYIDRKRAGMHQSVDTIDIGRPHRETVIGHDDIVNLTIALGLAQDVSQFINLI